MLQLVAALLGDNQAYHLIAETLISLIIINYNVLIVS